MDSINKFFGVVSVLAVGLCAILFKIFRSENQSTKIELEKKTLENVEEKAKNEAGKMSDDDLANAVRAELAKSDDRSDKR